MLSAEVLVLNSGYIPINIISAGRAISLVVKDKAKVIVEDEYNTIRTSSTIIKIPKVIVVGCGFVPRKTVRFSKQNVIYRDDQRCQYCGKQFPMNQLTIDHVIPISRWKKEGRSFERFTSWENCVCACEKCNTIKADRLLSELNWKLPRTPIEPKYMPYFIIQKSKAEKRGWIPFCKTNVKLVDLIEQ